MRHAYILRAVLGVVFAIAAFATAVSAHASNEKWPEGRLFLERLDALRFNDAFQQLSESFWKDWDLTRFSDEQRRQRERLGTATCREQIMQLFTGVDAKGEPTGLLQRYRTRFSNSASMETIRLVRDALGTYRVDGYQFWPIETPLSPCPPRGLTPALTGSATEGRTIAPPA